MPRTVGIWIDHTKAVIVFASADRVTAKTVESDVGPHAAHLNPRLFWFRAA